MKCRVEDGHVRHVRTRRDRFLDTPQGWRVVERCEAIEVVDRVAHSFVDDNRLSEMRPSMNDPMGDRVYL